MNKTINQYGVSLLVAVTVAAAGHYYATHHPPSHNDAIMAYFVGLTSGFSTYLALRKKYLDKHITDLIENADTSTHSLITKTETERLYHKNLGNFSEPIFYDHDFYYSRLKKAINLLLFMGMLGAAIYFAWLKRFIVAAMVAVPFSFIIRSSFNEFLDKEPQVRIAEKGIWVKDFGFKPWEVIQKINIKKNKSGKNERTDLEIFLQGNEIEHPDSITAIDEIKNWKDISMILLSLNKVEVNDES